MCTSGARKSGGAYAWDRILHGAMMINREVDRLRRAGVHVKPRESGRGAVVHCRL